MKFESPTKEDELLHDAGLIFNEWLSRVRLELVKCPECDLPKPDLLRAYVALINREYKVGLIAVNEVMQNDEEPIVASSFSHRRLPIGRRGFPINVESTVSGARYPLSEVLRLPTENQAGKIRGRHAELLSTIGRRLQLGVTYNELYELWAECLWNGWYVEKKEQGYVVKPPDNQDHIRRVLGETRNDNLMAEFGGIHAITVWNRLPNEIKANLRARVQITGLTREGKRRKLLTGLSGTENDPPPTFPHRLAAEEMYWNELLLRPLPRLANLSVRKIFDAWDVLSSLGFVLEEHAPTDTGVYSMQKLFEFAVLIPEKELMKALRKRGSFSSEELETILKLLSFSNLQDDPWQRPLVDTGEGNYLAIIASLTVPNLVRSIENWMRVGGLDLDARGGKFEDYVKHHIKIAVAEAPVVLRSELVGPLSIEGEDGIEEIDLLWLFGSTLLVGETKCSIYPATAIERYRYCEVLAEAALQVKRKVEFVKKNLHKVLPLFPKGSSVKVVSPFIITNRATGAGLPMEGVPVTDLNLLTVYLLGHQDFLVPSSGGTKGEPGYTHVFFSSGEEAENNIVSYLDLPFGVELNIKLLDGEIIPMPSFSDEVPRSLLHIFVNYERLLESAKGLYEKNLP